MSPRPPAPVRRGAAAVAIVVALLIIQLAVIGVVLAGARDQDLTASRADTVRAFYAAEAGMNMAIREVLLGTDADGDGAVGSISDDGNSSNDPAFHGASVSVTLSSGGGQTTLTSDGRSGRATRRIEAVLE